VLYKTDTTPLGRVLGEVIVTEEAAADLPVPEERAVLPLPHAITVANTMSDNAPKTFLIIVNISPSLENLCNCWPEVLPVANGHSFADRSGRQGCPKTARDYKTRLLCGCFVRTQQCDEIGAFISKPAFRDVPSKSNLPCMFWGQKSAAGLTKR
jgi:hypothetical protein